MSKRLLILMCSIFLIVPLVFMGCSGDDGATGPQGQQGLTGPRGEDLTANPVPETCSVCHRSVATTHAQTGAVTVSNIASARNGAGDLVTTFNVKVDGVNNATFVLYRGYAHLDNAAQAVPAGSAVPMITTGQRNTLYSIADNGAVTGTGVTFVNLGAGNYSATVPVATALDNADYLFLVKAPAAATETVISAYTLEGSAAVTSGTTSLRNLVSDAGCTSCHGPTPAWSAKFRHYAVGGSKCQVCHGIVGRNVGIITLLDNGTRVESQPTRYGTNAVEYFHGIHNSEGMPDNAYFRSTNPAGGENSYAIGYPSDMRNCKVCHTEPAQLTTAATKPVSFWFCMSCHQSWKSFPPIVPSHTSFNDNTNCAGCHNGSIARATVSDFHNSFEGVDPHLDSFYGGTDISFDNPDNVLFTVTGVTKSGDNVAFRWTASKLGAAVNPCNTDNAAGPTFQQLGAYLAYAKGDDWVNENLSASQSPGQPLPARNLFTSLSTTCDNTNVATTTGLVVAAGAKPYAKKALLAIGGKPITRHSTGKQYFVRVASPTYAFSMATGASVAARRSAVDTKKCIACHRGTLYQHGGDRVDNEQLCVICHNPSSSEKNVRVGYRILNADNTVNTSKTYDGKSAETYDMRYLLHAIHGAEKRDNPIIIYRSRGVFAFAPEGAAKPTGWPAGGSFVDNALVYGSTNNQRIGHTWTIIDYPKPVNACEACHVAGLYEVPDQTKAVALTVEPGTSWPSQTDDVSIGPAAAACTACHASSVARSHALKQGYLANVLKEEMLLLADPAAWWLPPTP
jgi:OmcA/MtrC family decaheme c-type cytochrome